MTILKMTVAILLAFLVFIGTIYLLSELVFEKIEPDDYLSEEAEMKAVKLKKIISAK